MLREKSLNKIITREKREHANQSLLLRCWFFYSGKMLSHDSLHYQSVPMTLRVYWCVSQPWEKYVLTFIYMYINLRMRQCCGHLSLLKGSFDQELLENEKKEIALEHMFQSMAIDDVSGIFSSATDVLAHNRGCFSSCWKLLISTYVLEPTLDLDIFVDKSKYFDADSGSAKVDFVMTELNKIRSVNVGNPW